MRRVAGLHQLLPQLSVPDAAYVVMMAANLLLGLLCYLALWFALHRQRTQPTMWLVSLLCSVGAVALMFIGPINLFTPTNLYFGYITPHVYHNPTVQLMQPLAVVLFLLCLTVFDDKSRIAHSPLWLAGAVGLTLLCLLAKPSFHMALLPALGLLTLIRLVTRQRVNWLMLFAIGLPAGLLLIHQTLAWQSSRDSHILFEPLRLFDVWARVFNPMANQQLLTKLLASIAFPLVTTLLMWRQALRSSMMQLAWLCMAAAMAYLYLLVDSRGTGRR